MQKGILDFIERLLSGVEAVLRDYAALEEAARKIREQFKRKLKAFKGG